MDVVAEHLVAGGDAIGHLPSGKVVFISGALPGETVRISLTDTRKDFARATVEQVIEASPERVSPPCPHVADHCGGCQWQHLSQRGQRDAKIRIAAESLARTARLGSVEELLPRIRDFGAVPAMGSRTTVRIAFDADGKPGFRRQGSHDVVPIGQCLVAHPLLNGVIPRIAATPGSDVEVTLRCSTITEVVGATVHGDPDDIAGLEFCDVVGDEARLVERVGQRDFVVSMGAFFQSSPKAAELLVDAVRTLLGPEVLSGTHGSIVDAYGGGGLLSGSLVPAHVPVTLVEENPFAVADARRNLADNSATTVKSAVENWTPTAAGVVIADPARQGLGPSGVATLAATGADTFVLVSCDAAAGARDIRMLLAEGYELDQVGVIDMFPHTNHLEMVSLLRLRADRGSRKTDSTRDSVRESAANDVPPAA
jgi:tRNA/tmRNA/rRNA uracil-C5-methylase (TrmA/RlmC/RlmD family)